MKYLFYSVLLIAVIAALSTLADEPNLDAEYCDMRHLYKSSNGEFGYPPYRGDEVCNEQQ